ncbi:LysR family transcriptional regulator [Paenibacillus sp. HN-1]|uniref:LysR family transcriptional regulator n=1 Tax=Paenibacillus TaxID=44249 RepID=UPI001CA8D5B7|nr:MULTISPECIES: LysR family transcriptional regulator [Paenibacillus]MBY9080265.1 LysR family transcriptional regulator [Paenibacillus sp. CGMCC 1.18879]MBY9083076.1 LysR family transcriptional regulator [Paenibacillus sinensis]
MITDALRVFVTVAEERHFSRAAERLNLSQPGVSLHIRNLENELGARLFNRNPKQVSLTDAGEILYARAKVMLGLYEEAAQAIALLQNEVTGTLRIGASFTVGEYVLPGRLAAFVRRYPLVEVEVRIGNTEETVHDVKAGTLDLGLIEGETHAPDLDVFPFMKDEMVLVAAQGHPLAQERSISREQLQKQVWVIRENGSGTRAFSDSFISKHALDVKKSYIFNSSQGVKEGVASGLGISILSKWIVRRELESGEIVELQAHQGRMEREFSVIMPKSGPATMAVQVFRRSLDEHSVKEVSE